MSALVSIGGAQLRVIGLNPQHVSRSSETRLPGRATFTGMDYQKTGRGPREVYLEAMTVPHLLGGLDALGLLQAHHDRQDTVRYIRLERNYLGRNLGDVVIRELHVDEDHFHPFTGIGRTVNVEISLVFVGDT